MNFRAEVCAKAKNLALALQWIKEIETATSLKDLMNPKSITGKDFSDYEELDWMMAAELKRCYDEYPHFKKVDPRRRAESSKGQPISQKESDSSFEKTNIFVSTKLQSVWPQLRKGAKFLHRAEDCRMFSAEDNWVLF